jgi:hypothetical protein
LKASYLAIEKAVSDLEQKNDNLDR